MSIPLLKALANRHPYLNIEHVLADAGYDFDAVYEQIRQGLQTRMQRRTFVRIRQFRPEV
jgi:hypothetical protein